MKRIAIIQINEEGEKIASQIRQHFPKTIIINRVLGNNLIGCCEMLPNTESYINTENTLRTAKTCRHGDWRAFAKIQVQEILWALEREPY